MHGFRSVAALLLLIGTGQAQQQRPDAGEPLVLHDPVFPLHQDEFEQGDVNVGIDYPYFRYWMTKYIVNDDNRGQIGVNAGNNRQGDCYRFACEETSAAWFCATKDNSPDQDKENVVGIAMNIIHASLDQSDPNSNGPSGYQDEPDPYGRYRVYVGYGNCNLDPSRGPYDQ